MSVYASLDENEPAQIASNTGWSDVCEWIDTQDAENYPETAHLRDYGWSQETKKVAEELLAMVEDDEPTVDGVRDVVDTLMKLIGDASDAEVIEINNGMVESDDDSEEKEESEPPKTEKSMTNGLSWDRNQFHMRLKSVQDNKQK